MVPDPGTECDQRGSRAEAWGTAVLFAPGADRDGHPPDGDKPASRSSFGGRIGRPEPGEEGAVTRCRHGTIGPAPCPEAGRDPGRRP